MVSKYAIFCSVIELGLFTKTAKQLNYSQSAVSQTIKNLEEEIGTRLLTRGNEGIKLTKDGQTLYPYFQQIVQGEKQLSKKIKECKGWIKPRYVLVSLRRLVGISFYLLSKHSRRIIQVSILCSNRENILVFTNG